MQTRYFYLVRIILACSDLLIINLCFLLGFNLATRYGISVDADLYKNTGMVSNLIWMLSTAIFGLYSECTIYKFETIYRATWRSVALHLFVFLLYLYFSNAPWPKLFLLCFYGILSVAFLLARFTATALQTALCRNFDIQKAVAVLGLNRAGFKLASYLQEQSSLNFVGFIGGSPSISKRSMSMPEIGQQLKKAAESGVEEVFVSVSANKMNSLTALIKEGEKQCVRLKFVPDFSAIESNFKFDKMGNFTVLCARKEPLENVGNRAKKRIFDIIVSLGVIIFIFSWLYPLLAILIKLQSRGPVLFKQLRTGRDNKPFWCYKFRSMRMNEDSDSRQATLNDDRITPIGRFMRRTSLDEFPQFFNVLLGYMSIIGPRPHMVNHTEQYRTIIDKYMVRQFLKPGISGWAQINGYRGETKNNVLMEKRVEHDIWYMENWSVMLDIKIMFFTVINIFRGEENAY